jgi:2-polyprenyl-6-methoxyphenol hydroxylase-like FAD-dependent oxidoreductase
MRTKDVGNRDHAVVLGASMAGLLAARVLSGCYRRVTVVERDELPQDAENRKGVPQGRHVHGLAAGGSQILAELFPGLLGELVAHGAPVVRNMSEMYFSAGGGRVLCRRDMPWDPHAYHASRPLLECRVRDRVRALSGVEFVERCEVVGLATSTDRRRVTGAHIVRLGRTPADTAAEETLEADLVVDTTGRAGRLPTWLSGLGYQPPPEQRLPVQLKYVTQVLRLPADAVGREHAVIIGPTPGRPTGLGLMRCENDLWLCTAFGYGAHHPPTDRAGLAEFLRPVLPPRFFDALQAAEPVGDVCTYRFPANFRRRYDRLRRFPAGLLVLGDAMCSFNPIYGQGMTLAALEAVVLRDTLASGDRDLARRFFRATRRPIDLAWQTASAGDLALPEVTGPRPLALRALTAFSERVLAAAEDDPVLSNQFLRVAVFVDPPTKLVRPRVLCRVLVGNLRRQRVEVPGSAAPQSAVLAAPTTDHRS